eukprot:TRINITY_DN2741_c0_g1_i2.p1 TRINITY_DN2741_c0_g1~~TRINITY_DN2741_c0_g1_i2.p1  ORF type:complete len:246 (+),score=25.47 TRINITY_DN2741_c0_g1_i2:84-821(+)
MSDRLVKDNVRARRHGWLCFALVYLGAFNYLQTCFIGIKGMSSHFSQFSPMSFRGSRSLRASAIPRMAKIISELEVGEELDGKVTKKYSYNGVFINVGAEKDGYMEFAECSDGFPAHSFAALSKGASVRVRVLERSGEKLHLTCRSGDLARPARVRIPQVPEHVQAFEGITPAEWLDGTVSGMIPKGLWIELSHPAGGEPISSVLLRENFANDIESSVSLGMKVKVRITDVDLSQKRVNVTMLDP